MKSKLSIVLKIIIVFLVLSVFGIILPTDLSVQHKTPDLQRENFPDKPTRIVSLSPNLTEIVFALGLGDKVAAVSDNSNFPAEAAKKKRTGSFWQPNIEAIIASRPDLVLTLWFQQQKSVSESLKKLGYKTLVLRIETIEQLYNAIEEIGEAAGCEHKAEMLVTEIRDRIANLKKQYLSADKVKVLWVVQPEPLRVAGRNTFINSLIELVGGENAIGPTLPQYPCLSGEEVLACGAEVIIQPAMGTLLSDLSKQQRQAENYWSQRPNLPAVRNNRIYVIEPDTILRLGPRLGQGLEIIGHCLHPRYFNERI